MLKICTRKTAPLTVVAATFVVAVLGAVPDLAGASARADDAMMKPSMGMDEGMRDAPSSGMQDGMRHGMADDAMGQSMKGDAMGPQSMGGDAMGADAMGGDAMKEGHAMTGEAMDGHGMSSTTN